MEPKLRCFFVHCILPAVLCGRDVLDYRDDLYCYCKQKEFGPMIACDNPSCLYEWFHFPCVNLVDEPDGDWFCPDCRI